MTQRNWSWEAKQLLPHLAGMLGSGVTVQAGGGSMMAHALNSSTWHTGTLAESQAPWAVTSTVYDAHVANANAHHARDHVLATNVALGGTHSIAGATAGHVLRASAPDAAAFAQLQHTDLGGVTSDQHHAQVHGITDAAHHTVAGAQYTLVGVPTTTNVLGMLTPTADASASGGLTAILRSNGGSLGLLGITSVANITMGPLTAVLPTGSILKDLGDYNRKWRSLYAAELYVETLVAQDVLATIGGRIMVAPTTKIIADLAAGGATIDVEHNNLTSAFVYMASAPGGIAQVEVMKCGATATPITGGYRYTVTRNLDGSGANAWVSGDAVANIGAVAGQGWIELTSTNTARNHLGPTIAIYARTGTAAWTDVKPVVALGNLRSFVDYAADQYGFALGNDLALTPATGFSGMTGDRTSGLRMFNTVIDLYSGATRALRIGQADGIVFTSTSAFDNGRSIRFLGSDGYRLGALYATGTVQTDNVGISLVSDNNSPTNPARISLIATNANASGGRYIYVGLGLDISIEIEKNTTYTAGRITLNSAINQFDGISWFANGTAAAPSIRFMTEAGMGLYRYTTNTLGIAASGVLAAYVNSGSIVGSGNIQATTSLHAGTLLAVGTTASFQGGATQLDQNSGTYRGLSMKAFLSTTWAFGLTYRNNAGAMIGSWAAYGTADALSYLYGGVNYADNTLRVYPATDRVGIGANVVPAYTLDVTGSARVTGSIFGGGMEAPTVKATTAFYRDATRGGVFVPLPSGGYLVDTGGTTWNGATARAAGTYTFDMQAAANGSIPADAIAILCSMMGKWSAANDGYYTILAPAGGTFSMVVRAQAGNVTFDQTGIVLLGTNGDITATVAGAVPNTWPLIRIHGYFT